MRAFEAFYICLIGAVSLYGLHRYWLVWGTLGASKRLPRSRDLRHSSGDPRPAVLIQLPIFNEWPVVERLIESAVSVDWPTDRLEVQVLDDSDDGTHREVAAVVERWRRRGLQITHLRRTERDGYKAGALQAGLEASEAEFVAIFDADFVVPADFLRRTVPFFEDSKIGMVQARWGFLNESENLVTRVQTVMLDGHFHVEHRSRAAAGRFFNFNGTAGVWRRRAIDEAGGWKGDTITEDLDLSLRAWLEGWKFHYLDDLEVPSELPAFMAAYKIQQNRWVAGAVQTGSKLLGKVLRSPLSLPQKIDLFFYLTGNFTYVLLLLLALAVPPAVLLRMDPEGTRWLWADLPFFFLATVSVFVFCGRARRPGRRRVPFFFLRVPAVMALGLGMTLHNTRAILRGLFGRSRVFVRTPKAGGAPEAGVRRRRRDPLVWGELLLGLYVLGFVMVSLRSGNAVSVPFLSLFVFGYLYVFLRSSRFGAAVAMPPRPSNPSTGLAKTTAVP